MKIKQLTLTLACVLGLCACGQSSEPNNSDSTKTEDPTTTDTKLEVESWKQNEITSMKEHLSNYVLPFIELENYEASYDEAQDLYFIETPSNKTVKLDESYYNILLGEDIDTTYFSEDDIYQSVIYLENLDRIYIQFQENDTTFFIVAWAETHFSGFPEQEVKQIFSNHSVTISEALPHFDAESYFITDFIDYYGCVTVEIPTILGVEETEDVYVQTLTEASWTIDKSDYEASGILALSPNSTILLSFYLIDNVFTIDIYDATQIG